jgi:hypothetical protein
MPSALAVHAVRLVAVTHVSHSLSGLTVPFVYQVPPM